MTSRFKYRPEDNQFLASLPKKIQHVLFPHLELVALERDNMLFTAGEKVRFAYFPINSVIALQILVDSGASTAVTMVGKEGLSDVCLVLDGRSHIRQAVVQHPGLAWRLPGRLLKEEFNRHAELMELMLKYIQLVISETSQIAMCNRYHPIDQQLCRWLLLTDDRLGQQEIAVTQEWVARTLGVRRESINEAVRKLQKKGIIKWEYNRTTILDRKQLEDLSCTCYSIVKFEHQRIFT